MTARLLNCFNPRTRKGCDVHQNIYFSPCTLFQSTHPQGVRLSGEYYVELIDVVSIHAPARGATRTWSIWHRGAYVSIHAPARGATSKPRGLRATTTSFNPRTRKGCDRHTRRDCRLYPVSIHAPARGATSPAFGVDVSPAVSIHAPARGATEALHGVFDGVVVSIHAPARGATQKNHPGRDYLPCFNPRTRKGCDSRISNIRGGKYGFNPRTRKGCDQQEGKSLDRGICFNPRTRKGCDWNRYGVLRHRKRFQSTHPQGVRHMPGGKKIF